LYTDWFLNEIIGDLAKIDGRSTLIYASDHGENILDEGSNLFGHEIGTQYDLRTAAFVWLSPQAIESAPAAVKFLNKHRENPLSLSDLSHSFLDFAGIEASGLDKTRSLFRSEFVTRSRWYRIHGKTLREQMQE
jgi:heptose-I-phosphate ethanolaminephosphotransferase